MTDQRNPSHAHVAAAASGNRAEVALARHGESTWNVERRMQGFGDPPLTARGLAQARALAAGVRSDAFDVVITSDLQRARDTALLIAAAMHLLPQIRPEWREHDIGAWTGLTREEVRTRWPGEYERYRSRDETVRAGGGETRAEFRRRIVGAYERTLAEFAGAKVLVVTHRGAIRVLAPRVEPAHATLIRPAWRGRGAY